MQDLMLSRQWKTGKCFLFRVWGGSHIKISPIYWFLIKNVMSWLISSTRCWLTKSMIYWMLLQSWIHPERTVGFGHRGFLHFLEHLQNVSDRVLVKYEEMVKFLENHLFTFISSSLIWNWHISSLNILYLNYI